MSFAYILNSNCLMLKFLTTCIVRQRPPVAVKDKPALLPGFDFAAHLYEKAPAGFLCDGDVETGLCVVAGRIDVGAKVEVVFSYW